MKYLFKAVTVQELVVEADNEDAAFETATMTPFDEWDIAERPEAELVDSKEN